MRVNAPPISKYRLQRTQRWLLLWLRWFAAFLNEARAFAPFSAQATVAAHHWLDRIERILFCIVMARAAPHVRVNLTPRHSPLRRIETHFVRAVMGASLRRALRSKDLNQRIAALSQDVDVLIARLLKRLPRGLTRRRSHHTRPEPRSITLAIACTEAVQLADTS